jgi:hypothetical protein
MTQMNRAFVAVTASVLCISSAMAASLKPKNPVSITTPVEATNPFTHIANIPAGADLSSIKFQGVKKVKIATRRQITTDVRYFRDQQFMDPGGSMYCPSTQLLSPKDAYQVTYSYDGPALASDEYGNAHFAFSVYFQPDELGSEVRRALTRHTMSKADMAAYFDLSAHRTNVRQVAIDQAASTFCEGNYFDGNWVHKDSKCQDKVDYTTVSTPSDYVTVQVDPASARQERVAAASR